MAKDFYHYNFKNALLNDGWTITDDPFDVRIGRIGYEIDLGAEKLIAAHKGKEKIAVEIKNFLGPSEVNEFHKAMGQYNDYSVALELFDPERVLWLAIPEKAWDDFFQEKVIQLAVKRIKANIIVFKPEEESITLWIP
jgi:hypothetical protein